MVYRLVTANTIDQRIVERAAAKRKLEKMIIHSKKFKSQDSEGLKKTMEAISPQELLELLNSKDHAGVVDRLDGVPFSDEELNLLLDRSDLTWAKISASQKDDVKSKATTGLSPVGAKKPPPAKRGRKSKAAAAAAVKAENEPETSKKSVDASKIFCVVDQDAGEGGLQSINHEG